MAGTQRSPADDITDAVARRLHAAGCVFAEEEAGVLVSSAENDAELDEFVERRCTGAPIEHIVGWAAFAGRRITVAPGVFVPRRRSELLVRLARDLAPAGAIALDVCCGSGAVGAALAHHRPDLDVWACDIDPAAVACARRNLPADRVVCGDLFDAVPTWVRAGVVLANAPYVPSDEVRVLPAEARDHEPLVALDGGSDGLDVQRRVAAAAGGVLSGGGVLLVETGRHQADATAALLARHGWRTELHHDDDLDATVAIARRD